MNKLQMQSSDITSENVKKIAKLFPHCVTERLNKDGKEELAIDFDKLKDELSPNLLGGGKSDINSLDLINVKQIIKLIFQQQKL